MLIRDEDTSNMEGPASVSARLKYQSSVSRTPTPTFCDLCAALGVLGGSQAKGRERLAVPGSGLGTSLLLTET